MRGWRIDRAVMRAAARDALAVFGEGRGVDPDALVRDLAVARQQMVEIARAVAARVLVMDEPTAALDDAECERLFGIVVRLKERGTAVVYITDPMREIARLADRVTVLKDGQVSAAWDHVPPADEIIAAMVGRALGAYFPPGAAAGEVGAALLSVPTGGNQQKVIVARWLAMAPRVLVFVEPTRGIDVNTKAGIYAIMRDLARRGGAVMLVS